MPDDLEIANDFLRSDFWKEARDSGRWLKKRGLKDAIREYLTHTYAWMGEPDEHTEREAYVGRISLLIRSRWGKKAARTRKRNKLLRERLRVRRKNLKLKAAERAHKKWRKARAPELFGELPTHLKPKKIPE